MSSPGILGASTSRTTRWDRPGISRPRSPTSACTRASGSTTHGCSRGRSRSEEHTSELQSLAYLVCRLLLEKKKKEPRELSIVLKSNCELGSTHPSAHVR